MKRLQLIFLLSLVFLLTQSTQAQLPEGSIAPDFTITDTDGVEHNLYTYLNQGKHVVISFDATWVAPSWSYFSSNALNDLYDTYGPEGTDEYVVLMIEADETTTLDDLNGVGNDTQGDWLSSANFPVADGGEDIYENLYAGAYFPLVYGICPSGFITEVGQSSTELIYSMQDENCCDGETEYDMRLLPSISNEISECGIDALEIGLQNNGANEVTSCTLELEQLGQVIGTYEWNGSLLSCEYELVLINDIDFEPGNLTVSIQNEDDNSSNNSITLEASASNSTMESTSHIRVSILTDSYPQESQWVITNSEGVIVAQNGPFSIPETTYQTDVFLPSTGCYFFNLIDTYGDGLNAEQTGGVNGDINLTFVDQYGVESPSAIDYQNESFYELSKSINNSLQIPVSRSGVVFYDENENGVLDVNEDGIPGITVIHGGQSTVTSEQGAYLFTDFDEVEDLSIENDLNVWPTNTTPNSFSLNSDSNYYNNFGLSANSPNYSGEINYSQSGVYVCEQNTNLVLSITNTGNANMDAEVTFELDSHFTFLEATPAIASLEGQILIWVLNNIPAGGSVFFNILVTAPDWQTMGEELTNTVMLDIYDQQGNLQYTQPKIESDILFCSYDPNDKQVFPEGTTENHYVASGTRLEYFIQFQNTGNYFATDVTVSDPISELLDLETFELVSTSHPCYPSINYDNSTIDFHFPQIMLPDSTTNEPDSHGFISFLIDHVPGISQPAPIENTAYIYFDSNPAVVTNTTLTTIDDLNTVFELSEDTNISVYPNPAHTTLTISTPGEHETSLLIVKDAVGRTVLSTTNHLQQSSINIASLANGIYLLEWRTKTNALISSSKFIKE